MKLRLKDFTVRYGTGHNALTAVDAVSLDLPEGKTVGLVGESGCGKSSIARGIMGLAPVSGGQIQLDGVDFSTHHARSSKGFRRRVQMVFQDPYSSLNPRMRVLETLTEVMSSETPRAQRRKEALRMLNLVGLAESALKRYPHQFSGGQRQRIAIARTLAIRPDVIILDEVTSSLDVSVQATILNLLRDLQSELKLSYLFISHDLSSVRYMSDAIVVMYLGRIVETAETNGLFRAPVHPYTQVLMESIPKFGEARRGSPIVGDVPDPRHPPSGCRFRTRCPVGPISRPDRTICIEVDPQIIAGHQGGVSCHFANAIAEKDEVAKVKYGSS